MRRPSTRDAGAILAMVREHDTAVLGYPDFSIEDVQAVQGSANHDPEIDEWLVYSGSELVGWAFVENAHGGDREDVEILVHPSTGDDLYAPLMRLLLDRVAERAAAAGRDQVIARAGAVEAEPGMVAVIRAAGGQLDRRYARMHRDLTGDEPSPQIPPWVRIRTVDPSDESDLREFYQVIGDAFAELPDFHDTGFDGWWARVQGDPSTPYDQWWIAEVDGRAAGIVQSSDQARSDGGGWIRNLAVRPRYRGRGLATLLLRYAFAVYAAAGRRWVGLGADTGNPTGAFQLYESVGMHAAYRADTYEWPVLAAAPVPPRG